MGLGVKVFRASGVGGLGLRALVLGLGAFDLEFKDEGWVFVGFRA